MKTEIDMNKLKELTFEKACKIEKLDAKKIIAVAKQLASLYPPAERKSVVARDKVMIMVKASNRIANGGKPWKPDFDDAEWKYEPRFIKVASSGFRFDDYDSWCTGSDVGSRLCFKTCEVMKAMVENKHYMKVYNEYAL